MKYAGMPMGMWMLFHRSFTHQLTVVLGQSAESAKATEKAAKQEYRRIIARVPDFEPGDRFQMNLVNCAMLCAYVLHMPKRPTVQTLTDYYAKSMMTPAMRWFCRKSGKNKFSDKDIAGMKQAEKFHKCGICVLMKELGLYDLTPAMCRLDYTMAEAGEASDFVREYTLASGGSYCDCGYHKKQK